MHNVPASVFVFPLGPVLNLPALFLSVQERLTNYYRRFPGDYLRDTQHLSLEQHGAYCLLLDIAYTSEKPLPFDVDLICRMTRAISDSERLAINYVIEQFFVKSRWGFTHKRVGEEIKHAESRVKAAKENGRLGGRPPVKSKPNTKPSGLAKPNPEKSSPDSRLQTPDLKPNTTPKQAAAPLLDLPVWIPESAWKAFVDMRSKMRAPINAHAAILIFKRLAVFMQAGSDPREVLEQSIMNNWRGVFEIKRGNLNGRIIDPNERVKQSLKNLGLDNQTRPS